MLRRRLLNLLTALSLLLCVATAVMWVRSHWREDWVALSTGLKPNGRDVRQYVLASRKGLFACQVNNDVRRGDPWKFEQYSGGVARRDLRYDRPPTNVWERMGFVVLDTYERGTRCVLPWWLATAASGIVPVAWMARVAYRNARGRRRQAAGHCSSCGYDLRATPDGCPECGMAPGTLPPSEKLLVQVPRNGMELRNHRRPVYLQLPGSFITAHTCAESR